MIVGKDPPSQIWINSFLRLLYANKAMKYYMCMDYKDATDEFVNEMTWFLALAKTLNYQVL